MTPSTPRVITPDDKNHSQLQADVEAWLRDKFLLWSNAYHDKRTDGDAGAQLEFKRRITRMGNVTALIVRTTADRIAIHRTADFAMYLEYKTISDPKWANLAVEALPLAIHREKAKCGARCLYIVRDVIPGREFEGCFWADSPPPFDSLFIPNKHRGTELDRRVVAAFPALEVERRDHIGGSGDPFVRLKREAFANFLFPCWKTVITDAVPF